MRTLFLRLPVLFLCVWLLPGCKVNTIISSPPQEEIIIPLIEKMRGRIQIARINIKNSNMQVLTTLPLYYPVQTISSDELAILEYDFCPEGPDKCKDIIFERGVSDMVLSPNNLRWIRLFRVEKGSE